MPWIDVLSRVVHVGTAITLVGGSVFMLLVLLPSLGSVDSALSKSITGAITGRWKRVVHVGILLFLISGFYNYYRAIGLHKGDGLYHGLVGAKMMLAFVVFFFASALVGRSERLAFIRENKKRWLTVTVILAALIVAISGFLKIRGVV